MIKAVIYDVDGTIVDSEALHVLAWDKALRLHKYSLDNLSDTLQASMAGRKPTKNAEDMIDELHLSIDAKTLTQQKTDIFMKLLKTDLRSMPGLKISLEQLKKAGYKLAIGTSQVDPYIGIVLDTFKIANDFAIVVKGDEIINGKPHPDTYLVVAKKLGVLPRECVVIEDATSGIQSAKSAGCICIAIKNSNALPQDISQADFIISSLAEVTDTLIRKLDRAI